MSELARIETRDLDSARLVRIIGEIDLSNARHVLDAILAAVPRDAARVVVDLGDTSYLDSSGIAMIFRLAERLKHSRQELRLVVPTDSPIRRVIELTNVHEVIAVQDAITGSPDQT